VNTSNILQGVITTRELLELEEGDSVGEFMNPDVISARVDEDREEVARRILRYNLSLLPIVDARNSIIGVVSSDDALEVVEEEGSEDALLLAGASGDSDAGEPLLEMVGHRAPYLAIPVGAGLIMSKVMEYFTRGDAGSANDDYSLVIAFVPMVLALSGTVGMQTSAVLVRGFAVGQIVQGRRLAVFLSEIYIGVVLGFLSALVAGPAMGFIIGDYYTGIMLSFALWLSIIWTNTVATSIVVGSEAAGLDPALVAGPVMIAVSDLSAVALFLGAASMLIV
jgi:magnesium transporter